MTLEKDRMSTGLNIPPLLTYLPGSRYQEIYDNEAHPGPVRQLKARIEILDGDLSGEGI